jgi:hypothetical protein
LSFGVFVVEAQGSCSGETLMAMTVWRETLSVLPAVVVFAAMPASFTTAPGGEPVKKVVPKLDQAEREAIVAAANQAIARHAKAEKKKDAPDEIDASFWGEPIAKLKPIRARSDRGTNVAIVLSEEGGVEEGLYVWSPNCAYAHRAGDKLVTIR